MQWAAAMAMTREEAETLLELVPGEAVSVRSVRTAWARKVRVTHPDTAPEVAVEAGANIKRFNAARDLLLEVLAGQNNTCQMCRGVGTIRARLGRTPCQACNGTGDKFRC